MGAFDGWWFDPKTGKGWLVHDHGLEVLYYPGRFGLTKDDIKAASGGKAYNPGDTGAASTRWKVIKAAFDKGFVRVRSMNGHYHIQLAGNAATKLKKVIPFMRKNGMGPYSEIGITDLSTGFDQTYEEGAADVARAIRNGEIPDSGEGKTIGVEAKAAGLDAKDGVPADLDDQQKRTILRQRISRSAGIPDRGVEESKKVSKPLIKEDLWTMLARI